MEGKKGNYEHFPPFYAFFSTLLCISEHWRTLQKSLVGCRDKVRVSLPSPFSPRATLDPCSYVTNSRDWHSLLVGKRPHKKGRQAPLISHISRLDNSLQQLHFVKKGYLVVGVVNDSHSHFTCFLSGSEGFDEEGSKSEITCRFHSLADKGHVGLFVGQKGVQR